MTLLPDDPDLARVHRQRFHPLWMLLGLLAGVSTSVVIAVQLRLASIDLNDPATWPEMGPQMAYFAIPEFTLIAALPAFLINWLFDRFRIKRVACRTHWFVLGTAYSLIGAAYPLATAGINGPASLVVCGAIALCAAVIVRQCWGDR